MYIGVTDKRRRKLLRLLEPYVDVRVGELVRLTVTRMLLSCLERVDLCYVQSLAD